jgi:DNA replication protein DnaC
MLEHPTLDKLAALKLTGMLQALQEQRQISEYSELSFEERLGLLVDREVLLRQNRQIATRMKKAGLRQEAAVEDIDFRHPRDLDRSVMLSLAACQWIRNRRNCLITGPTGVGKTFLACALAQKSCREGFSSRYVRVSRLLGEFTAARLEGGYPRKLGQLAQVDLLVLDDWGVAPFTDENRRDLLEILDDRYDRRSTLVTSQIPVEGWHAYLADPTLADAILDRLVHNAHRLTLTGESIRRVKAAAAAIEQSETSKHNVTLPGGKSHASKA